MAASKTHERRARAEDRAGEAAAHAELHADRFVDIGDRAHHSWEISHVKESARELTPLSRLQV